MTTQVPPDELTAENELICEKLIGWERTQVGASKFWICSDGHERGRTPSFTTWTDAGLILDALSLVRPIYVELTTHAGNRWLVNVTNRARVAKTGPLAIRAAALSYIRSLP